MGAGRGQGRGFELVSAKAGVMGGGWLDGRVRVGEQVKRVREVSNQAAHAAMIVDCGGRGGAGFGA